MPTNNKKITLISFFVILVIGIFLGGYFVLQSRSMSASNEPVTVGNSNSTSQDTLFISPNLNYSVTIPDKWYTDTFLDQNHISNMPPHIYDIISNESVGAPLEMSDNGVSMTVEKLAKGTQSLRDYASSQAKDFIVTEQKDLVVNGLPAIQQLLQYTPGIQDNQSYSLVTFIEAGDYIYELNALSSSLAGRTNNADLIKRIAGSFKTSILPVNTTSPDGKFTASLLNNVMAVKEVSSGREYIQDESKYNYIVHDMVWSPEGDKIFFAATQPTPYYTSFAYLDLTQEHLFIGSGITPAVDTATAKIFQGYLTLVSATKSDIYFLSNGIKYKLSIMGTNDFGGVPVIVK